MIEIKCSLWRWNKYLHLFFNLFFLNFFLPCHSRQSEVFGGSGLMDSAGLCVFGSRSALVFGTRSSS